MLLTFFGDNGGLIDNAFEGLETITSGVTSSTPIEIEITNTVTGYRTVLTGTGMDIAAASGPTGTLTGIDLYDPTGRLTTSIIDISWPLSTFVAGMVELLEDPDSEGPIFNSLIDLQDVTVDARGSTTVTDFIFLENTSEFVLLGSARNDTLGGGTGDDTIVPGASDTGERIAASGGNDTFDFTGHSRGSFVDLDYSGVTVPLSVTIDGTANTGTIVKQGFGTDTLINPVAALQEDGIFMISGQSDDTIVLDGGASSWVGVYGGEGNDSFDLTLSGIVRLDYVLGEGINANLVTGTISDGLGGTDTLNFTPNGGILELRASDNADTILGSAAGEGFILRGGNDTLDAGGGFDVLRYDRGGITAGVQANLETGVVNGAWDGTAFTHQISNVEEIRGANFDDTFVAAQTGSRLIGRGGNDILIGGLGTDTLRGGSGDDLLDAGDSQAFDIVDPGRGDDTIEAVLRETGYLFIDHSELVGETALDFNLDGTAGTGLIGKGSEGTTQINGVTQAMQAGGIGLVGSHLNDTFAITVAEEGFTYLRPGRGNDTITLAGATGDFRIEFALDSTGQQATQGMRANLETGLVSNDGFGGQDTITRLTEVRAEIRATNQSDVIVGSAGSDGLVGLAGADTLTGGADGDALFGSGGNDVIYGDVLPVFAVSDVAAQVYRLYQATLDRAPDATGYQTWTERLFEGERGLVEVAQGFVDSTEFQGVYGTLDNPDFVTLLYQNVLERDASTAEVQGWVDRLGDDLTRADVVVRFSESTEFQNNTRADAAAAAMAASAPAWQDDVYRLYQATLDRAPDEGGFLAWVSQLAGGRDYLGVVGGFVQSPEFVTTYGNLLDTDFVELLYLNVLDRASDASGLQGWLDVLSEGGTRAEVVRGFAQSDEFRTTTQPQLETWIRDQGVHDALVGGTGDNTLAGGVMSDRFIFAPTDGGTHRVLDLEAWDTLSLTAFGYQSTQEVRDRLSEVEGDLVFADQGVSVIFENRRLDDITDEMIQL
ncbi:DUF4214 domain-containing protein [Sulfitobacter sp. S190]|uniref:DUF4214 domain-containing protein n=1 Tax=Sulfitobacter sp. S190 TaxID=2867022 RepID=UPI0021A403A8|nr:DUF4214 domain-containing protein [Sulfitobacter sp. S190]UWR24417.1 DUF4214 domain-containing protein [Sulfitobacter sp. S190]